MLFSNQVDSVFIIILHTWLIQIFKLEEHQDTGYSNSTFQFAHKAYFLRLVKQIIYFKSCLGKTSGGEGIGLEEKRWEGGRGGKREKQLSKTVSTIPLLGVYLIDILTFL